ncbi:MAG TPA: hypothetical protein VGY54_16630 [Polyangiaceae bacterium]|jgi:hypothetical protein|nr:hypothetical protein [Polyangiaceae bacterium]
MHENDNVAPNFPLYVIVEGGIGNGHRRVSEAVRADAEAVKRFVDDGLDGVESAKLYKLVRVEIPTPQRWKKVPAAP